MKHWTLVVHSILVVVFGIASFGCAGNMPAGTTDESSTATRSTSTLNKDQGASAGGDLESVIRGMGAPVPFDRVFAELKNISRFKGEFETSAQFEQRKNQILAKCKEYYLIASPVDPEEIQYNADRQQMLISKWAFQNVNVTYEEFDAVFGSYSELAKAGIEIQYNNYNGENIMWRLPSNRQVAGTYDGQNAFGARTTIVKEEEQAWALFERRGSKPGLFSSGEDVWFRNPPGYKKGSPPIVFEMKTDPERARSLKQIGGLRAGVLFMPKYPYYATGIGRISPTMRIPLDCSIDAKYLIGDILAVALYDSSGKLLAIRETR